MMRLIFSLSLFYSRAYKQTHMERLMFYRLIESTLSFSLCVSTNRSISVLRVSSPKNIPTGLCACALAIALFANVETVGVSNELRSRAVTLSQLICLAFVIGATFSVCSWISWIEKSNFEHELEREVAFQPTHNPLLDRSHWKIAFDSSNYWKWFLDGSLPRRFPSR